MVRPPIGSVERTNALFFRGIQFSRVGEGADRACDTLGGVTARAGECGFGQLNGCTTVGAGMGGPDGMSGGARFLTWHDGDKRIGHVADSGHFAGGPQSERLRSLDVKTTRRRFPVVRP
ncbi:hypothetical protein GCM10029964_038120 [Kibdelosporangium lantanae]